MLHIVIRIIVAAAASLAALFWLRSAVIKVPDNIDTIVRELQRIAWWNGMAAGFSFVAALFGALDLAL
jgi:hypothetical protein